MRPSGKSISENETWGSIDNTVIVRPTEGMGNRGGSYTTKAHANKPIIMSTPTESKPAYWTAGRWRKIVSLAIFAVVVPVAVYKGDKALDDATNGDSRLLHDRDGDVRAGMLVCFLAVWVALLFTFSARPVFNWAI